MTNTKLTKRALLASVLSLLLCISMLVSSTFAWFTDSATTGVGNIVAGTLDIDLVDKAGESLVGEGKSISFVDKDGKEISNILWEPGCGYLLEEVKLVNKGNLYAKCKLVITAVNGATDGDVDQANVIDVYEGTERIGTLREILNRADAVKSDIILAPAGKDGSEATFGQLKLVMQETAGNEYQGKSLTGITVTVLATQYNAESDSFGKDYDENATYFEKDEPITSAELATMIANDDDGVIELTSDVVVNETIDIPKDVTLTSELGCAFTQGNGFNATVLRVAENASLKLEGVAFKGIVLAYSSTSRPALIGGSTGAEITLENVSVDSCTGVVIGANGADVVLDNGTVMTNNTFTRASGQGGSLIDVHAGSVTINDGVVIENNTCSYARDGLIAAYGDAKIVINGGKINNNVVTNGTVGSVIYVQGANGSPATASFTMNGGEITNNKGVLASAVASRWGNGGTCSIVLNKGTISGNTTTSGNWNNASVFYRCNTTIGADMVIDGVVYSNETNWTLTDNRTNS